MHPLIDFHRTNLRKVAHAARFAALALAASLPAAPALLHASKPAPAPIFFPLPPDEPRIQFLTSFSSEEEFQGSRKFYSFIVGTERPHRPIVKPYGIAAIGGKFYIADTVANVIEIADLKKKKMGYFQPGGEGTFGLPFGVAVDPDGTRYITDTKRNQVLIYKNDNYAGAIGASGEMKPVGIAVDSARIYVTDLQNHSVRVYDKNSRNLLLTFPKPGGDPNAQLFSPTNVAVDAKGNIYVSDMGAFRANVYDAQGKYIRTIGKQGLEAGSFARPKGIAVDREGHVFIADAMTQVIQVFDTDGHVLMYFGNPTSTAGDSTCMPAGIAIDYDDVGAYQHLAAPNFSLQYLVLVVNQFGAHKITVFGFGHKK